ncbi:unnamed protein product [Adineta steineri]|uniref:Thioredoxin-like protein n=2 Tax=Adineta steineri TaxID=433720 RepID=A0A819CZK4_9BILA|nr:unnamed protein product [Adineta steineri]CAF1258230.1 unnamed protein product [Adineta steineri]CAF3829530.1 unnamed protein product [Adineta steineri]
MARNARFANNGIINLGTLKTLEDVNNTKKIPDKLIVILFNVLYPDRDSLETRMKSWAKKFESDYNAQFYKCVVVDGEQDIKKEFKINEPPVVIFFRNGEILEKIDQFIESDPNQSDITKPGEDSKDEKKVKERLIHHHNQKSTT